MPGTESFKESLHKRITRRYLHASNDTETFAQYAVNIVRCLGSENTGHSQGG